MAITFQDMNGTVDIFKSQLLSYFHGRLHEQFKWLQLPKYAIQVDMENDMARMCYRCRVRIDNWVQEILIDEQMLRQNSDYHRIMDHIFSGLTRSAGAAFFAAWIDRTLDTSNDFDALMAFRANVKDHIEEVEFRGDYTVGPGTMVAVRLKDTLMPFTMILSEIEQEPRVAISKLLMMVA